MKKKAPAGPSSSDIADKVREAEIANIGKKLKAGKTLNAREAALVSEYSDAKKSGEDTTAMNLKHGAALLGCTVADLKRIRDAGCPGFEFGRPKIPIIRKWMQANPGIIGGTKEDNLKERHLLAKCLKIEHEVEIAKGQHVHQDEIARVSVAWAAQVRAELMALKSEAPTWAGLSPAELQDKADQFIVMALGRLQAFHAPIQNQESK